jgi:hypothetical protein
LIHHTLPLGENTPSSLPSCFHGHLCISSTLDDVWLIPGEVLLLLTESAFLAVS